MLKILVIHTKYIHYGGEDVVVEQEIDLLKNKYEVKHIFFQNKKGLLGALQFLMSIWNIKAAKKVRKQIKCFKPDVVHLHNWHYASGPLIIRTVKSMNVKLVCTLHNYRLVCPSGVLLHKNKVFVNSLEQDFPWDAIIKKVYRNSFLQTLWLSIIVWFHKKIKTWYKVDTYICLAPFAIDLFLKSKINISKETLIVKPNFTKSKEQPPKENNRKEHFLFVGRLSPEKGIIHLLETFKKVPYKIKIAGDGSLRKYVEQTSLKHNNIEYLGSLSSDRISEEMQQANALIFSSIWMETFGLTIIEAFANRCAVISSNIGAPSTIVSDKKNGFHYDYGEQSSLKKVVINWYNLKEDEKEGYRDEAYNTYTAEFSVKKQQSLLERIYN